MRDDAMQRRLARQLPGQHHKFRSEIQRAGMASLIGAGAWIDVVSGAVTGKIVAGVG